MGGDQLFQMRKHHYLSHSHLAHLSYEIRVDKLAGATFRANNTFVFANTVDVGDDILM